MSSSRNPSRRIEIPSTPLPLRPRESATAIVDQMPMPEKRRRRRKRSPSGGSSRRRASCPSYQSLIISRLAMLQFPPSAEGDDTGSVDPQDLTPGEVLQALTRRPFLDNKMLDALVEYQVQKCLNETNRRDSEELNSAGEAHGRDSGEFHSASEAHGRDSGEIHSVDVAMVSVDLGDEICHEDFLKDCEKLRSRRTPVDEYTKLDDQELDEQELRHARYRIKAYLLLIGKAIDKLDDAALERKYPPDLIAKHSYFLHYEEHNAFGWSFDSDLCELAALTDYQRLVIFNDCGNEYDNWSHYRTYYNNPETDREYLLYWEAISEKLKWVENYIHRGRTSDQWANVRMKAKYQAIRIAIDFDNIHLELACLGFAEFMWSTQTNFLFFKDLDGVFFEIWKRVIKGQECFKKALKEVYDLGMFPSRELCMKDELDGKFRMEEQFCWCTVGITKKVPEDKARELIAQQVKNKLVLTHGYEQYAAKKLKVAEYIGLISKTST